MTLDPHSAEARDLARRAVAHYSDTAGECQEFLAMLGLLEREALCVECELPMSRPAPPGQPRFGGDGLCWQCYAAEQRAKKAAELPLCACGRRIPDGQPLCKTCRAFAPADEVRVIVARLRQQTGRSITAVAEMAGVKPTALTSVCVPSSKIQKVRKDVLDKVKAAEERWERLHDYNEPIRLEAAIVAPGGSTRCGKCGKSMGTRDHPEWGEVRYGANGFCETCYQQQRRAKEAS
ncbi:hypothetical protein [Nocardia wallacei]|uniref:hypothetical protein n=1 Tax=Nocardia wallacei TaxID=480035 RepID=UPI002456554E|nr:hypothetical protein [Nocardia wallacei]